MGKPSAPAPPDPVATAQAQTSQNVGTAVANNVMQMTDQITPWYTVTHEQTGTYQMDDPLANQASPVYALPPPVYSQPDNSGVPQPNSKNALTGGTPIPNQNPYGAPTTPTIPIPTSAGQQPATHTYDIPLYTQTVTLPEDQQAALDAQFATNNVLSNTALEQAQFLQGYLGDQIDVSGLPEIQSGVNPLQQSSRIHAGGIRHNIGQTPVRTGIHNGLSIQSEMDPTAGVRYGFESAGRGPSTYGGDFSSNRREVEDALMQRMDPYLARDREALETRLANQGITPGSEAYDSAMMDAERQRNDARLGAILAASEEQARLTGMERDRASFESNAQAQQFGQNMATGQFYNQAQGQQFGQNQQDMAMRNAAQQQDFMQAAQRSALYNAASDQKFRQGLAAGQFTNSAQGQQFNQNAQRVAMENAANQAMFNADLANANMANSARNQGIQEAFALRNQPINEIAALMSGSQVQNPGISTPSFSPMPTTDYAGIVANNYNQQMQNYNAEMAQYNNLAGGLFGLGSSAIGLFGG